MAMATDSTALTTSNGGPVVPASPLPSERVPIDGAPDISGPPIAEISERTVRRQLLEQIGTIRLSAEQRNKLRAPLDPAKVSIKPTGEVFVAGVHVRRLFLDTFASWGLRPLGEYILDMPEKKSGGGQNRSRSILYREYALVVNGKVVAIAIGEQEYHPSNSRMTYADAAEGVRTNALSRCGKDLGVFSEVWDRAWTEAFKREHCVQVWLNKGGGGQGQSDEDESTKPVWRRLDAEPFWNEKGIADSSPNQDAWKQQRRARGQQASTGAAARPEPERRDAPQPPVASQAQSPTTVASAKPEQDRERVIACRPQERKKGTLYHVRTTVRTYYTEDKSVYEMAEQAMKQGLPLMISSEARPDSHGDVFYWIVEVAR